MGEVGSAPNKKSEMASEATSMLGIDMNIRNSYIQLSTYCNGLHLLKMLGIVRIRRFKATTERIITFPTSSKTEIKA